MKKSLLILSIFLFSCVTSDPGDVPAENSVPERDQQTHQTEASSEVSSAGEMAQHAEGAADTAVIEEPESVEEPESAAPPLSDGQFLKKVQNMMPWNMKAVMDGSTPLVIVHDLDKNGQNDALVIAVEGGEETETGLDELSKSTRLFQSGKDYYEFLLLIFYQQNGEVDLRYTVPVARKLVFKRC